MNYCEQSIDVMVIVYGIKNCDSVKKACAWLTRNNIEFQFHDFRKDGLTLTKIRQWTKIVDWETLLNRRGTTWRNLSDTIKSNITMTNAQKLMAEQPTLIKRPVVENGKRVAVGFSQDSFTEFFSARG